MYSPSPCNSSFVLQPLTYAFDVSSLTMKAAWLHVDNALSYENFGFICLYVWSSIQLLLPCECELYFIFTNQPVFLFISAKPVKFAVFSILMQTIQNILEVSVTGCAKGLRYCDYLGYVGNKIFQNFNKTW